MAAEKLLNVEQAAELTGYKQATIRSKILKRQWPFIKLGRSVRIKESFISQLIDASEVPAREKRVA
jgi:excisionase family DNA binding protein